MSTDDDPFRRMKAHPEAAQTLKDAVEKFKPGTRAALVWVDPDSSSCHYVLYGYPYNWEASGLLLMAATHVSFESDCDEDDE